MQTVNASQDVRGRRLLPWFLCALCLSLIILSLAFIPLGYMEPTEAASGLPLSVYAVVGALVASRQPRNAVGWLFLTIALTAVVSLAVDGYIGSSETPEQLFLGSIAAWLSNWLFWIWIALATTFVPLFFPDGRLPSPRWRPVVWLAVLGLCANCAALALKPGILDDSAATQIENPVGIPGTTALFDFMTLAATLLSLASVVAAGASVITRFRRARGDEREQLKWFAFVGGLMILALFMAGLFALAIEVGVEEAEVPRSLEILAFGSWYSFLGLLLLALPVAIGVAILRYRLYEIDVIINRALVYGLLTAFLAGLYAASIQLFKVLFEGATGETSESAVILTTLVLAAAFTPAKNKAQRLVDRYFGQVHDPHAELKAYADLITSVVRVLDISENARQFLDRAVDSLEAEGGAIFLNESADPVCMKGTANLDSPGSIRIPLVHNGDEIGFLALGPRSDGTTYTDEDLEALNSTAGQVARAIVLAQRALAGEGPKLVASAVSE